MWAVDIGEEQRRYLSLLSDLGQPEIVGEPIFVPGAVFWISLIYDQ
jgi:hypothetical protein